MFTMNQPQILKYGFQMSFFFSKIYGDGKTLLGLWSTNCFYCIEEQYEF